MQVDYMDYREVAGLKVPSKLIITWVSGRSTVLLSDVQANVPIDPATFARPAK